MKTKLFLVIIVGLIFSAATLCAAIQPDAQKEIDQLVQQDKFTEALSKVDAMLKDKPTDKDLLDLKAQLDKSVKPAAAPASAMTDEDRLEANTINRLMTKIRETTDAGERKPLQEQVLERSGPLVQKYPKDMRLWLIRATAALALDKARDGWEAGKNLKDLGALASNDPAVGDLMAELNLKKWLVDDYATLEKALNETSQSKKMEKLKFLNGTWGCKYHRQVQGADFSYSDTVTLGIQSGKINVFTWREKATSEGYDISEMLTVSGQYRARSVGRTSGDVTSGDLKVERCQLSTDGHFLQLKASGPVALTPISGSGSIQNYDLTENIHLLLDYENERLISVSEEEAVDDPKDLLKRLTNSESSEKRQIYTRQ